MYTGRHPRLNAPRLYSLVQAVLCCALRAVRCALHTLLALGSRNRVAAAAAAAAAGGNERQSDRDRERAGGWCPLSAAEGCRFGLLQTRRHTMVAVAGFSRRSCLVSALLAVGMDWAPRSVRASSAAINCFFKVDNCDSLDPFMECSEVEVDECPDIEYDGASARAPRARPPPGRPV
eukprot:COSAG02_NODE_2223_length_9455_cov_5.513675_12_plen_177_part_00